MKKICGRHDEVIYSKFTLDSEGLYFNDRLECEVIKRKSYTESRKKNREKKATYVPHMGNGNSINNTEDKTEIQKTWDSYSIPVRSKRGEDLTKEEIISLLRIPYGKRTQDQNRQVGQFTTSHPEFDTDIYQKDIY